MLAEFCCAFLNDRGEKAMPIARDGCRQLQGAQPRPFPGEPLAGVGVIVCSKLKLCYPRPL